MKKLILCLVFTFAFIAVTPVEAKNSTLNKNDSVQNVQKIDCIAMAFAADANCSYSYCQFAAMVDACEAAQ